MNTSTDIQPPLYVDGVRLPYRTVTIDGVDYQVPRGIARNNTHGSWQLKLERNGKIVIKGSISDVSGTPGESLQEAIRQLKEGIQALPESQVTKTKKRGAKITPIRISDQVTLHWKVVDATPFLYALVYSPILQKPKQISIGSDKKVAKSESLLVERVSQALAIGERIARDDADPYRAVSKEELESFNEPAVLATVLNDEAVKFILEGSNLRLDAQEQRAKQIEPLLSGIKSKVAREALLKGRRV